MFGVWFEKTDWSVLDLKLKSVGRSLGRLVGKFLVVFGAFQAEVNNEKPFRTLTDQPTLISNICISACAFEGKEKSSLRARMIYLNL